MNKVPFVVASNPVNYGVPYKLSCAEAIATALLVAGFSEEAEDVLSVFKWGSNFFVLNELFIILFPILDSNNNKIERFLLYIHNVKLKKK